MESIKPNYYQIEIKGIKFDVFDIAKAWNLPNTLFSAFKYFRTKGNTEKKINDLEKAIECIQREINYLKEEKINVKFPDAISAANNLINMAKDFNNKL